MCDKNSPTQHKEEHLSIPFEKKTIEAKLLVPASDKNGIGFIITHGAGGDMDNRQIVVVSQAMAAAGYLCLRFTCRGGSIDYRIRAYVAVMKYFAASYDIRGVILCGRSMGSRGAVGCANQMVLESDLVKGVICLAYPLHPPKEKTKLRDKPLLELEVPCFFISGDKDSMADKDLMETTFNTMKGCSRNKLTWIEGGDHGHAVSRRSKDNVECDICEMCVRWSNELTATVEVPASNKMSIGGSATRSVSRKRQRRL